MSNGAGAGPLVPTFHGFVHNSMDGLVLFEACLSGKLHHVPRRPHDRERASLIKSGSIFIYEENASGIKRWTDGVAWSPSRILGNFLIYRELEKPFPPGEKKRAMKRKRTSLPGEPYSRRDSDENEENNLTTPLTPPSPTSAGEGKSDLPSSDQDKELERSLIGSLVDSYGFRPDGLVKKTMSISVNGISHHMVSYYKVDDVKNNALPRPLSDPRLQNISVRPELYLKQNFRAPVEETEHYAIDSQMHAHPHMVYPAMGPAGYSVRPGQYFAGQSYPQVFAQGGQMYQPMTGTAYSSQYATTTQIPYPAQPGQPTQPYQTYYKPPTQPGQPKPEESPVSAQPMPYGGAYQPPYPPMQRNAAQGTPNQMASQYSTPVQPASATFANRPYGNGEPMASPATNTPQQGLYSAPQSAHPTGSQAYAVRSPTQSYGIQSAPPSAVTQSPHPSTVKSPHSVTHPATPAPLNTAAAAAAAQMPYRTNSYPVPHTPQSAPAGEMNGLGISTAAPYPQQQANGQHYSAYGTPTHAYRHGDAPAEFKGPAHYVQ